MQETKNRVIERLEAYKGIQAEIIRLTVELASLRIEYDSVKGSLAEYPYTPTRFTIKGINARKYKYLHDRRARYRQRQRRIEQYVDNIPDKCIRLAVQLHYLGGLSWGAVAKQTKVFVTSDNVRKAVKRYFSTVSG